MRSCNFVGLSIRWPDEGSSGGYGGHAITGWGDNIPSSNTLTVNPASIRVTDSDTDNRGDVQVYTYDSYTNPNPGGTNEGNGWYFNAYGTPHPFIKHIVTLSPNSGECGQNSVIVIGSCKIHQSPKQPATDLHDRVGTDVDILTYRTWIDWPSPPPTIVKNQPRRELTMDWNLTEKPVPYCTWITINTEFVERNWNAISDRDVHFTYVDGQGIKLPE